MRLILGSHITTCKFPGTLWDRMGTPEEGMVLLPKCRILGLRAVLVGEQKRFSVPTTAGSPTCTSNSHLGFYEVRGAAGRIFPSLLGRFRQSSPGEGRLSAQV